MVVNQSMENASQVNEPKLLNGELQVQFQNCFQMKTLQSNTTRGVFSEWQTTAPTPMDLNFISRSNLHHGWTQNMLPLGELQQID
jgi:hypothetical protein